MKKLLKVLLCLVLVLVLAFGGLLGFLTLTEYKPQPVEALEPNISSDGSPLLYGDSFSVLSWNIGYAGLGAAEDFFMDGGTHARPGSRATVEQYLDGIRAAIADANCEFVMLQEVDVNASRTYSIDEAMALSYVNGVHALNYACPFVPIPWPPMGKVNSGLYTTSAFQLGSSQRIALPCPFSWPLSTANLKRCLLVSHVPLEDREQELVLVNLHLEAYDDGEGKIAQTRQLMDLLEEEYKKGNYVIAGGDFNQVFPGCLDAFPNTHPENWIPGVLETASLPDGFGFAYDLNTPSCRLLNQPYDPTDLVNTQYYVIDGFIVSPNVTVEQVDCLDLGFADSDHNPVRLTVSLH